MILHFYHLFFNLWVNKNVPYLEKKQKTVKPNELLLQKSIKLQCGDLKLGDFFQNDLQHLKL